MVAYGRPNFANFPLFYQVRCTSPSQPTKQRRAPTRALVDEGAQFTAEHKSPHREPSLARPPTRRACTCPFWLLFHM